MSVASINDALQRVQANSPFLAGLIDRNADLMPLIQAGNFDAALDTALARSAETVGTALRKQRQGVAHALKGGYASLQGSAGAGKSFAMEAVKIGYQNKGYKVLGQNTDLNSYVVTTP